MPASDQEERALLDDLHTAESRAGEQRRGGEDDDGAGDTGRRARSLRGCARRPDP